MLYTKDMMKKIPMVIFMFSGIQLISLHSSDLHKAILLVHFMEKVDKEFKEELAISQKFINRDIKRELEAAEIRFASNPTDEQEKIVEQISREYLRLLVAEERMAVLDFYHNQTNDKLNKINSDSFL